MARTWTQAQQNAMLGDLKLLLVSAAAGSGKTSVLTERIIHSLTDKEHPADLSRLLIVTFTRAAAAELKGRIAEALSSALSEDPGNKHLSRQLLLLGNAQISTIDSFFQKAVKANFAELSLPATFRIANKSEIIPLCLDVLEDLAEEFYRRFELTSHGGDFSAIETNPFARMMNHLMSGRSDGKSSLTLLSLYEKTTNYPEGIELFEQSAFQLRKGLTQDFMETTYGNALVEHLRGFFDGVLADLEHHKSALSGDPDEAIKLAPLIEAEEEYTRGILQILGNCDYAELFNYINLPRSKPRFPTIHNKSNAVIKFQLWRDLHNKQMTKLVKSFFSFSGDEMRGQMAETAEFCHMLYLFFGEYKERILGEKQARGVFEFNDIRAMLYGLLTDESGAPSIYAKSLAEQYDAVYIDEYQDVDEMQDSIFSLIGTDHRFMVGDIKQSIYGFRGSDPSIFASYRRSMPLYETGDVPSPLGNCIFMSDNFRCDKPVIDFTNLVCSYLFSACEDSVGYRPHDDLIASKPHPDTLPDGHPAPVTLALFERKPRAKRGNMEQEDETEGAIPGEPTWIASEISRLLRCEKKNDGSAILPSDIAILVQKKKHAIAVVEELEALSIPVQQASSSDILHTPLMTDVLNLLRSVDNPYRDLPLSEFLLSDMGGFTPDELTVVRERTPSNLSLYEALQAYADVQPGSLSEKIHILLSWLEEQCDRAAFHSADRFLHFLYLDPRLRPFAHEPALMFLYEKARTHQNSAWSGLYGFLTNFEKTLEHEELSADGFKKAENAVTVMTIHHSKGLEFPVVFLCRADNELNKQRNDETVFFHKKVGWGAQLFGDDTGVIATTLPNNCVRTVVDGERMEESIRTLYVALTRARERLYVTGTLRGDLDKLLDNASVAGRGNRNAILSRRSYAAWILCAMLESCRDTSEFPCTFRYFPFGTVEKGLSYRDQRSHSNGTEETGPASRPPLSFSDVLENQKHFVYPYALLQRLPTKAAASKLSPDMMDRILSQQESDEQVDALLDLMTSATRDFDTLLEDAAKPKATEIGTATHAFLEFCSFDRLMKNGAEAEIRTLVEAGFLTEAEATRIDRTHLKALLKSDLLSLISNAKAVHREQTFSLRIPMRELSKDPDIRVALGEEALFVQGSIDLLIETTAGELILVDYKTDRISPAERADPSLLISRFTREHGMQLSVYARAVEELYEQRPSKTLIYSIPLGKTVELAI